MADESLNTVGDARTLAEAKACDLFNIRVSKNGGLSGALAVAEIAAAADIGIQVGAQVGETAILTAAGRLLAAHLPRIRYAEGSFGTLLLSEDISIQELRFGPGGAAPALNGPGLGIDVRVEALERLAIGSTTLRRGN
jgi:muconate cycloisomerase